MMKMEVEQSLLKKDLTLSLPSFSLIVKNRLTEELHLQLLFLQDKCYVWLARFVNVIPLQLKSFKENKTAYEINTLTIWAYMVTAKSLGVYALTITENSDLHCVNGKSIKTTSHCKSTQ